MPIENNSEFNKRRDCLDLMKCHANKMISLKLRNYIGSIIFNDFGEESLGKGN